MWRSIIHELRPCWLPHPGALSTSPVASAVASATCSAIFTAPLSTSPPISIADIAVGLASTLSTDAEEGLSEGDSGEAANVKRCVGTRGSLHMEKNSVPHHHRSVGTAPRGWGERSSISRVRPSRSAD